MPGTYCSVKGCKKYASRCRNDDISFHNFPKDFHLKRQWIDFCQQEKDWCPKPYSKICSLHFKKDDFEASYRWELLNIPTKRRLNKTVVPTCRETNCEEGDVIEEIILEYADSDEERLQTNFEVVDMDKIKEDSANEDLEEKPEIKPLTEIETLRKEIAHLKRKMEEQEQTICKMKALNESLAKDLHNERHRNLYLKNKLNLLEKEKVQKMSQRKLMTNGVGNSQNQILLIVMNDEKEK